MIRSSGWLLLSFLLCGIIARVNSSCYKSLTTAVSVTTSYTAYTTTTTWCWDIWNLFQCDKTTGYTAYHVTYSTAYKKGCCSGYGNSGCLPICTSSCGTNKLCSSPNTCTCSSGWSGSDCLTAICSSACGTNKQCSSPNTCTCKTGWTGNDCLTAICNPSCGTNKKCSSPNTCTCKTGWTGSNCLTPICNPSCGKNKQCSSPNTCTCETGWTGSDCLTPICNPNCGTNKKCSSPNSCTCKTGWNGSDCLTPICNPSCGTNMKCSSPDNCECVKGWEGSDCLNDIDECSMDTEVCEEGCTNTNGSYSCSCFGNKILAKDNTTCLDGVQGIVVKAKQQSLFMSWSPPANHTSDGVFTGYNVACYGVVETFVNDESYNLSSLDPFTDYKCCIEPYWSDNGLGPSVCKEMKTQQDAPSDSPHNITVIAADSESVLIQWSPPLIPNGIITHYNIYINYTDGTDVDSAMVDSNSTLYLLEQLNVYQLVGVSVSAITGGGEGPQSLYTFGRSGETEPDGVHYLLIDVLSNHSVNVSWHPPALLKGVIIKYHLMIRNLTESALDTIMNEWTLDSEDVQYKIEGLQPFVPYEVEIAAATSVGKGDIVRRQYFTAESVPNVPPLWALVKRVSIATISLEWFPLTLEESRGFLSNYTIKYTESISDNSQLCDLTGNVFEVVLDEILHDLSLTEVNPNAQYCVSIAASTAAGTGLFSQWNLVDVYKTVTVYFYISGIYNCDMWSQQSTRTKLQDFSNAVISAIQNGCQCSITTNHVHKSSFLPCKDGLATIKLSLFQVDNYGANALLNTVKEWVKTTPVVTIDNLELEIVLACNDINNCSRSLNDEDTSTSSVGINRQNNDYSRNFLTTPEYIAPAILGVVIAISVAMVIVIGIVIRIRKKRSSRCENDDMKLETPSISKLNPCYTGVPATSRPLPLKPKLEPTYDVVIEKLKSDVQECGKGDDEARKFGCDAEGYIYLHNSINKTDLGLGTLDTKREKNDINGDVIEAEDYLDPRFTIKSKMAELGTLPRGLSSSGSGTTSPEENVYEEI